MEPKPKGIVPAEVARARVLLTTVAALAPIRVPSEQDCLDMANLLERNPPKNLSPSAIAVSIALLRGRDPSESE